MIFKNTARLLITNFSNTWKLLLYYLICILFSLGVCYLVASPIIEKLSDANIFRDLIALCDSFFSKSTSVVYSLNDILSRVFEILKSNAQFDYNYIFLLVWAFFVFPFLLDLASLALGEVVYGFMTSQVKYSFTGRFVKNIGKSCVFALFRLLILLPINILIFGTFVLSIKVFTLGKFVYAILSVALFALFICFVALKYSLFACFMPAVSVLDVSAPKALKINFESLSPKKFVRVFSNALVLTLLFIAINLFVGVFTFSVSLIVTLPLTALACVVYQMVCFFSLRGMRFYVYQEQIVTPRKFEEQENAKKLKFLI